MNKDRFSRRAILKTMGISPMLIPLLHAEKALGAGNPKRFFAMVYGNGARPNFYPTGNDFSLPFGKSLMPLEPFKAKMIMPIGLDYKNILDDGYQYDGHFTYCATLTGTREKKSESRKALGASIDQMISDEIAKTVKLRTPMLTLGVRSVGDGCSVSWRSAGVQNPAQQQAAPLLTSLFSGASMPPQQVDTLLKRRKSVLDFVGKELDNFGKRLGSEDRMKIEQHAVSVRDIESRLSGAVSGGGGGANCGAPMNAGSDAKGNGETMFNIVAMAFKCDVTRVATITISDDGGGDGTSFPWAGSSGDFHAVAHASNDGQMSSISNWFFTCYANLAKQLDDTVEAGGTALDNSILTSWSNMDEGANHFNGKIPITMVGSAGGYFKTGQVLRYMKQPHNKLLTTLCNAMGLMVTTVGDPKYAGNFPEMVK